MKYKATFNNQEVGIKDLNEVKSILNNDTFNELLRLKNNQNLRFVSFGGVWNFERVSTNEEIKTEIDSIDLYSKSVAKNYYLNKMLQA
jgi:hypothetical protein